MILNEEANKKQLETLSNFALNLGTAWHLDSEYRKQENIPQNFQRKQTYLVKDFLENECARLHQRNNKLTLLGLRQAHISEAEKHLQSLTSNNKETQSFVHNVLVPIIATSLE